MQRYGLIGSGHRAQMYTDAIGGAHSDVATLVSIADSNPGRAGYHRDRMVSSTATRRTPSPSTVLPTLRR